MFIPFKNWRLLSAVEEGKLEIMAWLLENGANTEAKDDFGSTALVKAIYTGNFDAVELLLNHGASVDAKQSGQSVLHLAARYGGTYMAALLVDKDPSLLLSKTDRGSTPLHYAASWGKIEMVEFFLDCGCGLSTYNYDNQTPLDMAREAGNDDVVAFLEERLARSKAPSPILLPLGLLPTGQNSQRPVATVTPQQQQWHKLSRESIAHIRTETLLGYQITDIFNFQAQEQLRIVKNLATQVHSSETMFFSAIPDKRGISEAAHELKKAGGVVFPPEYWQPKR